MINDEIPIKIYRIVHTMGKTKAGGLRAGLLKDEYPDIFPLNSEDREPAASGIRTEIIRALLFFIFIVFVP